MKKLFSTIALAATCLFAGNTESLAQGSPEYGSGMKLNINPEGTKFVRFITWHQIWARSIENNPGTLVNGKAEDNTTDMGIRRSRFLVLAQINPRYKIVAHWGINNQTFVNGGGSGTTGNGGYGNGKKPQLFLHDAWNEFAVILPKNPKTGKVNKVTMDLAVGLNYVLGISRMSNASTLNFMTVDSPIFSWPTVDMSDQFARMFGVFAKGKAGKLEYRIGTYKPFSTTNAFTAGGPAVDNNAGDVKLPGVGNKWATAGYFDYQFFDQESLALPFKVGTYLGTKKVFNIGAGWYSAPEGTKSLATGATIPTAHDINLMSVDAFLDMPIGDKAKAMAVTAYASYSRYDFGPNYLRNVGIMNEGVQDATSAVKAQAGAGNARPLIGTGNIFYTQAGLLLPKGKDTKSRFQIFGAVNSSKFDALTEAANSWDAGMNWFVDGHHAKITLQHSNRPTFVGGKVYDHRGEWILQTQIYL
jgi:hypothetical protein